MNRSFNRKAMSLQWLELFEICSRKGSLQAVAEETGLSISTISHHLKSLEDHLGVALFNHSRRPMVLTPKGHVFLRNIEGALKSIRKAQSEAAAGNLAEASYLRIGTIEDLDSDIVPDLAVYLSRRMPRCEFLYQTDSSHAIIELLRNRQLDFGIAGAPPERLNDLRDFPLLRDPFVVVTPPSHENELTDIIEGKANLPFLRFTDNLIIARQIEAQMRRTGIAPAHGFACSNNQTLMAMVAAGAGWTITTPLLYARAKRFQSRLKLHRFPGRGFARTLAIVSTPDCSTSVLDLVNKRMRRILSKHALSPMHQRMPWLQDDFVLID